MASSKKIYKLGDNPNLKLLANLITFLDGYLAYYFEDPEPFRIKIRAGELGGDVSREWRSIEKPLLKMAYTVRRIPKVGLYLRLTSIMHILSFIFLIATVVVAILMSMGYMSTYIIYLFAISISISSMATIYSMIYRRRMNLEIDKFFREHTEKYRFLRAKIKEFTQNLIYTYGYYLRKQGLDPHKKTLSLYNTDYNSIKVVKKPGLLSKKYTVEVVV